MSSPVLIVDGLNFFMRHFAAHPGMSDSGEHVGGFVGFLGGLGSLCAAHKPCRVIVVWESGGNAKRRAALSSYKDGRRAVKLNRYYEDDIPATIKNHVDQVSLLTQALSHLPVTQIYVRDTEADDVIGYLGRYTFVATDTILVSSDKDLLQLVNDKVRQWSPGSKVMYDPDVVIEKFGVSPENFITARVFVGDSSDAIAGVKGAGFKSLSKWFPELRERRFVPHREIIAAANERSDAAGKTLRNIAESESIADRNWKLMHLDTSRLNGDQIKRIEDQLEKSGLTNKMALLRMLSTNGMLKFDIDRSFSTISAVEKS